MIPTMQVSREEMKTTVVPIRRKFEIQWRRKHNRSHNKFQIQRRKRRRHWCWNKFEIERRQNNGDVWKMPHSIIHAYCRSNQRFRRVKVKEQQSKIDKEDSQISTKIHKIKQRRKSGVVLTCDIAIVYLYSKDTEALIHTEQNLRTSRVWQNDNDSKWKKEQPWWR